MSEIAETLRHIALKGGVVWQWGQVPDLDRESNWKKWRCIIAHPRTNASPETFDSGEGETAEEALVNAWGNYSAEASEWRRQALSAKDRAVKKPLAAIAADLGIDLDDLFA
jgi:hypothetical protein